MGLRDPVPIKSNVYTCICVCIWLFVCICMGWLWLVGSMKSQVSFAKEPHKRDNILQKRPLILSILLTVATPYVYPNPQRDLCCRQVDRGVYAYTCIHIELCIIHVHACIRIHASVCMYVYAYTPNNPMCMNVYGVAMISRLLSIISLFCRISSLL